MAGAIARRETTAARLSDCRAVSIHPRRSFHHAMRNRLLMPRNFFADCRHADDEYAARRTFSASSGYIVHVNATDGAGNGSSLARCADA